LIFVHRVGVVDSNRWSTRNDADTVVFDFSVKGKACWSEGSGRRGAEPSE
jgi:hypothetical protein